MLRGVCNYFMTTLLYMAVGFVDDKEDLEVMV
jgi:hypothetical protein